MYQIDLAIVYNDFPPSESRSVSMWQHSAPGEYIIYLWQYKTVAQHTLLELPLMKIQSESAMKLELLETASRQPAMLLRKENEHWLSDYHKIVSVELPARVLECAHLVQGNQPMAYSPVSRAWW